MREVVGFRKSGHILHYFPKKSLYLGCIDMFRAILEFALRILKIAHHLCHSVSVNWSNTAILLLNGVTEVSVAKQ